MLPARMLYIDHGAGGGPEALKPAHAAPPALAPGQVLIEVHHAGVNRPDIGQRQGSYPPPPDASPILGLEVAGRVISVGQNAERWRVGDQVCALVHGGGYAEYVAAHAAHCLPVPRGWSLRDAASLPETFFTVWANVFDTGRLRAGESILVHGGAGGIGATAIQLAKSFGAAVVTTVSSKEKARFALELGADHAIDYRTADFEAEVRKLYGPRGVDMVLDFVGGPYVRKNLGILALDGRLIQLAFLQGREATLDLAPLLMKRITFTGSALRPRTVAQKAAIARDLEAKVWPLLERGAVKPAVNATFPLEDAATAHTLMESSRHLGKIVLDVRSRSCAA